MSNYGRDDPDEREGSHLEDVPDGCGCAEVWEFAAERRQQSRNTGGPEGNGR